MTTTTTAYCPICFEIPCECIGKTKASTAEMAKVAKDFFERSKNWVATMERREPQAGDIFLYEETSYVAVTYHVSPTFTTNDPTDHGRRQLEAKADELGVN